MDYLSLSDSITPGPAVLRVMVSSYEVEDPCTIGEEYYGEYEDYCIYLDTANCGSNQMIINPMSIDTTEAFLVWNNPYDYDYFQLEINRPETPQLFHHIDFIRDTFYTFNDLEKCKNYKVWVIPFCSPYKTADIIDLSFKTQCTGASNSVSINNFKIYPNPINNYLYIENDDNTVEAQIKIIDLLGNKIYSKRLTLFNKTKIDINKILIPGMYFLKIEGENISKTYKIIKN